MSNLGIPGTPSSPSAQRVGRPGWRDPRLWIGVVLVCVSVAGGARLLAGADDTVQVLALEHQIGAGGHVGRADLVVRRIRFAEAADRELYFGAGEELPSDAVLDRTVGEGELLARSAVKRAAEAGTERVSVQVDPGRVDPDVHAGSVVDVYLADPGTATHDASGAGGKVLSGVTVLAAPSYDDGFTTTGDRQLVLAVPVAQVDAFERERSRLQDPVINVDVR